MVLLDVDTQSVLFDRLWKQEPAFILASRLQRFSGYLCRLGASPTSFRVILSGSQSFRGLLADVDSACDLFARHSGHVWYPLLSEVAGSSKEIRVKLSATKFK